MIAFMRMMVETQASASKYQRDADLRAVIGSRWIRLFVAYGEAPGSHKGLWHTNTGTVHGWNLRIGSLQRNVTFLAHTRPGYHWHPMLDRANA